MRLYTTIQQITYGNNEILIIKFDKDIKTVKRLGGLLHNIWAKH